ncbi:hypothetical protein Tco_0744452, partial [Tanacetum coccineum]
GNNGENDNFRRRKRVFVSKITHLEQIIAQQTKFFENAKIELFKKNQFDSFSELENKSGMKKNLFESETCVFQIKIVELEKTLAKQTKENSDLLMKIDNLENAFADEVKRVTTGKLNVFDKENCDFGSKVTHLGKIIALNTKDFDDVKLKLSNRTAKFEAYFEKLENTKVVLERQLARKIDDSKAEKDQFLKEIDHLRTQLENLKGKSVQTKFDKHLILGKPPADKLLINSQISKSWFTPNVDVQKSLSKSVTAQSLPKDEKYQLLKRIAYLESKLASQDICSCQKEYHELRTSYNALKVKFDSLNRQIWNINVSKASKPKESVSEKVHTGESSKPFSRRVSQFTTYSLQKDRKCNKVMIKIDGHQMPSEEEIVRAEYFDRAQTIRGTVMLSQSENLEIPVMTTPTKTNGGAKTNTPHRTPSAARPLAVLEGQDEALHWLASRLLQQAEALHRPA